MINLLLHSWFPTLLPTFQLQHRRVETDEFIFKLDKRDEAMKRIELKIAKDLAKQAIENIKWRKDDPTKRDVLRSDNIIISLLELKTAKSFGSSRKVVFIVVGEISAVYIHSFAAS